MEVDYFIVPSVHRPEIASANEPIMPILVSV